MAKKPNRRRPHLYLTVSPRTVEWLARESEEQGTSRGQIVDRLVAARLVRAEAARLGLAQSESEQGQAKEGSE